jgi:hypothetical protein
MENDVVFAEDFARCLAESSVSVEPGAIPPPELLAQGLERLGEWISSLDDNTKAALDEVTADFPAK